MVYYIYDIYYAQMKAVIITQWCRLDASIISTLWCKFPSSSSFMQKWQVHMANYICTYCTFWGIRHHGIFIPSRANKQNHSFISNFPDLSRLCMPTSGMRGMQHGVTSYQTTHIPTRNMRTKLFKLRGMYGLFFLCGENKMSNTFSQLRFPSSSSKSQDEVLLGLARGLCPCFVRSGWQDLHP